MRYVFILSLFVCGQQTLAMQQKISPCLDRLPLDLKRYLIPFVASGHHDDAVQNICTVAILCKGLNCLVNEFQTMHALLSVQLNSVRHIDHFLPLYKKLSGMPAVFPAFCKFPQLLSFSKYTIDSSLSRAAVSQNGVATATLLTNKNLTVNYLTSDFYNQNTPLLTATIFHNHVQGTHHCNVIQMLLDAGANPNARSRDNDQTPLMIAVNTCKKNIVKMLLRAGASPDYKDNDGKTAADYAWQNRNIGSDQPNYNPCNGYAITYSKIFNILKKASFERKNKNC